VTRTVARIAIAGAGCALFLFLAGLALEHTLLGGEPAAARRRVEDDVRGLFATRAATLKASAQAAVTPATMRRALDEDVDATRALFAAARAALPDASDDDAAVTVFGLGLEPQPIAWAGRPSEFTYTTLAGGESWRVTRAVQRLRLVYVAPVMDGAVRIGTVATEMAIPNADQPAGASSLSSPGSFRLPTRLADVQLELFAGARTQGAADSFDVQAPDGRRLLTAYVSDDDLDAGRARWHAAIQSLALIATAVTVLLLTAPLLDWRNRARRRSIYVSAAGLVIAALLAGRVLLRWASPADWSDAPIFSAAAYASPLFRSFLGSPFDFLLDALVVGAIAGLLFFAIETWRLQRTITRRSAAEHPGPFLITQLAAGSALALLLIGHEALIRDTIGHASLDLLHFSLHPWDNARIALQIALVLAHAGVAAFGVLILRVAMLPWRVTRSAWRERAMTVAAALAPLVVWQLVEIPIDGRQLALVGAAIAIIALASALTRLEARYRHGTQAFRLTLLTLGLIVPAFAFYPAVFQIAWEVKTQLVETRFAPQARNQRDTVKMQVRTTLDQIDQRRDLAELIGAPIRENESLTDRAFQVWQQTALADVPLLTSSVELYRANGNLVSRFAFNLPEDLTATTPRSEETSCDWDVFEEVTPFFADHRRVLHAGRALCINGDPSQIAGSVVVHAILDYANLSFIQSETPYIELLRPQTNRAEGAAGRDVEFAVYGWSRTPLYSSTEAAWPLSDEAFATQQVSHDAIWVRLRRGGDAYDVYVFSDQSAIYALGFPVVSPLGHLVNLAELIVLAAGTYVLLLAGGGLFGWLGRRSATARKLLREVRASFYRKLFLAFVAAVIFPVAALAFVTRQYVADEMRRSVAQEAVRTASAARRVVEDLVAPRAAQQGAPVDDNLMVWISRLIDQDVNIFSGPQLLATSERTLFASELLPTRIPADIFDALMLRREAAIVTRENAGPIDYLVAATPLTYAGKDATLTVPLTSRERQIEDQIDTFDRRVLLAALLFILGGSWLGYQMAERIADPVNRLTRATRRIARGDLNARVAATSSDELRRLVEDFNSMAADLQRQRGELERTHRLEAWAEMARQVAHEIKNPLTPIQLNAEHLRRVHADRGEPLGPVLQECVATILQQVKLLRQIASEFSSFASSPTARFTDVDVAEMLHEIVDPYRAGLADRIRFDLEIPAILPKVHIDRTLIARSLTNIVENALHAMPGAGRLSVIVGAEPGFVRIRVSDTGAGMDEEALARAFEPYFSTKATGTGLGLPIAKRNVELNGGSISVASARDQGTSVELTLPAV
jgi:signal transduction histidine kinase